MRTSSLRIDAVFIALASGWSNACRCSSSNTKSKERFAARARLATATQRATLEPNPRVTDTFPSHVRTCHAYSALTPTSHVRGISLRDRVRVYTRRGMRCIRVDVTIEASSSCDVTGVILLFHNCYFIATSSWSLDGTIHIVFTLRNNQARCPMWSDVRCIISLAGLAMGIPPKSERDATRACFIVDVTVTRRARRGRNLCAVLDACRLAPKSVAINKASRRKASRREGTRRHQHIILRRYEPAFFKSRKNADKK